MARLLLGRLDRRGRDYAPSELRKGRLSRVRHETDGLSGAQMGRNRALVDPVFREAIEPYTVRESIERGFGLIFADAREGRETPPDVVECVGDRHVEDEVLGHAVVLNHPEEGLGKTARFD